jgi:hypothetical protein
MFSGSNSKLLQNGLGFLCYHVLSKQEQLQNGFTASPYKPTHSLKKATLLQNGGPGCIFKTLFY